MGKQNIEKRTLRMGEIWASRITLIMGGIWASRI
jgi:hypothetical protein